MADGKKNILVYRDWIHQFDKLTDEEAGQLIKHFFRYVNDQDPEPPNRIVEICFEPIKETLKRYFQKWEATLEGKSRAGLASAEKRKQNQQVLTGVESVEQNPTNPTDKVKVSVKDNVSVNDNESVNEKPLLAPEILQKSNLFRKPNIPELPDVQFAFTQLGGTKEMAQTFYEKNEALGWFLSGGPITNFRNLVPSFIKNWKLYENKTNGKSNGQPAKVDYTKVNHDPNDKF